MGQRHKYYVVMNRVFSDSAINDQGVTFDKVMIFDFAEAVERHWVNENGERVWVMEPDFENRCITFVYGFNDLTQAIGFCEALTGNELGIRTVAKY